MKYNREERFFIYMMFYNFGLLMGPKTSKIILISQIIISVSATASFLIKDIYAQSISQPYDIPQVKEIAITQDNSLIPVSNPVSPISFSSLAYKSSDKTMTMTITAYTSCPEETDSTPTITASGKLVKDGVVANNLLPFGTKIKIPEIYGDKVFEVQDRMHWRMGEYRLDIWFPEKTDALEFGRKKATVEILEN